MIRRTFFQTLSGQCLPVPLCWCQHRNAPRAFRQDQIMPLANHESRPDP
jgi:hypothetical protein